MSYQVAQTPGAGQGDVGMGYGRGGLALVFEGDDALVYDPTTLALSQPLMEASQGESNSSVQEVD